MTAEDEKNRYSSEIGNSLHEWSCALTPFEAADEMIAAFCNIHGTGDDPLSVVLDQFKMCNEDFTNPTEEGLVDIAVRLVNITQAIKSPDTAKSLKKRFLSIIARVEQGEHMDF